MDNPLDTEVDRAGTNSVKWEYVQREGDPQRWDHTDRSFGEDRVLPMWVADMDFRSPEPVVQALVARAQHGIFGYTVPGHEFHDSVAGWMRRRHNWEVSPDWICIAPGVVPALNMLVRTFVAPGDKVLIQPPVYYPFFTAIERNGAGIARSPLIYDRGRYEMDFEDLGRQASDPSVKLAILCSPHNPVGRVWSPEELRRFGEICLEHDVLVISDEIHQDLTFKGSTFTPFARLGDDFAQHCVVCAAPSKTFNLAGLHTSCIIIANQELRARFISTVEATGLGSANPFGVVALQAAYDHGEEWLERLLDYLQGNLDFLEAYVAEHIPQIHVVRPEGTYLVWLDCRELGLSPDSLRQLMLGSARVYLDEGALFGPEGEGFERINIACPRSILQEALGRMREAIAALPAGA